MVTITSPNTGCENCVVNLQPGLQHHGGSSGKLSVAQCETGQEKNDTWKGLLWCERGSVL